LDHDFGPAGLSRRSGERIAGRIMKLARIHPVGELCRKQNRGTIRSKLEVTTSKLGAVVLTERAPDRAHIIPMGMTSDDDPFLADAQRDQAVATRCVRDDEVIRAELHRMNAAAAEAKGKVGR